MAIFECIVAAYARVHKSTHTNAHISLLSNFIHMGGSYLHLAVPEMLCGKCKKRDRLTRLRLVPWPPFLGCTPHIALTSLLWSGHCFGVTSMVHTVLGTKRCPLIHFDPLTKTQQMVQTLDPILISIVLLFAHPKGKHPQDFKG